VSVRQVSAESAVAPNLVPMVDVMFLLLLFLMVTADQSRREFEDVALPVAASARVDPPDAPGRPVVVNVHPGAAPGTWATTVRGRDRTPAELRAAIAGAAEVAIRADRAAPYEHVQRVMTACAETGIRHVEVAAATKAE
jgi:biopolymer transport protein ExbD